MALPHQRNPTERATDAAIDTACRLRRLPTIRRARRRSERRIKAAGFPWEKSLLSSAQAPGPAHQSNVCVSSLLLGG